MTFLLLTLFLLDPSSHPNEVTCKKLQKSLANGDAMALGRAVDLDAFFNKLAAQVDKDLLQGQETKLELFADGVAPRLPQTFVNNLKDQMAMRVTFLGMSEDQRSGLFRFFSSGYLNYLRVYFDDQGRIEDLFWHSDAETISEALTFAANLMLVGARMDDGSKDVILDPWYKVAVLKPLLMKEEITQVLSNYQELPEDYRRIKNVQITHFHAAFGQDAKIFGAALSDLDRLYPNDGSFSLLMLDALMIRGLKHRAMQAVENLARIVNQDPYLDLYRAAIFLELGELDQARKHLEKALTDPDSQAEAKAALEQFFKQR